MTVSELAQRKVVTTAAFNLRCKHIVHIDTSHYVNNDRLTTAYLDILKEADNLGLNSIALPAIGTGTNEVFTMYSKTYMLSLFHKTQN